MVLLVAPWRLTWSCGAHHSAPRCHSAFHLQPPAHGDLMPTWHISARTRGSPVLALTPGAMAPHPAPHHLPQCLTWRLNAHQAKSSSLCAKLAAAAPASASPLVREQGSEAEEDQKGKRKLEDFC
ncbi:hypothetical protein Scep_012194 [Stephania cephalantha]|uniref:Uncharacterized protein n=1 Tax=Stephania cephalantha TaxID=152367 RepID=A0AAP0JEH8_9MAGN